MKPEDVKRWHGLFGDLEIRIDGKDEEATVWCLLLDLDDNDAEIQEWDFSTEREMLEFFGDYPMGSCIVEGDEACIPFQVTYGDGHGYHLSRTIDLHIKNFWIE